MSAVRQIERAHDYALEPALCELNEKHAAVCVGGKTLVISEQEVPIGRGETRTIVNYMKFVDFTQFYGYRFITVTSGETTMEIPTRGWTFSRRMV